MKCIKRFFEEEEKKEPKEEPPDIMSVYSIQDKPELRVTGIYGNIEEEKCSETIYGLHALHLTGQTEILSDPEDEDSEKIITYEPIDFFISTFGGLATEMFSVYDTIRSLRDMTPIHTRGLGKVMSAGVLLLASGTKGQRRIGKHCRVMIHGVVAGTHGHIADVENEFAETKFTQKMYIKALAEETNMTEKQIKKMVDRKTNVYIDADEAVKLGIADIVV
jgi:ATP-dependent Clp endopeptidase proteolytic subunit ClpP